MSKKILFKRPTPLHQFTFCSTISTEKSTDFRNILLYSTNLKTTSRMTTPSKFFMNKTQNILNRNRSSALMNSSRQLNSVIFSHKGKLEAFNNLIDDIYQQNKNEREPINNEEQQSPKSNRISFSVPKLKCHTPLLSSRKSKKDKKDLSSFFNKKNQEIIKQKRQTYAFQTKRLLRANVSLSNVNNTKKLILYPDMFIKKNRFTMNRFILRVLDPDACLDDYTPEKGTQNQYFNKFKFQLNKENKRINNLLDNLKKAEAMNETWLKFYVVKLRNAQSKYYHMPQVNSN